MAKTQHFTEAELAQAEINIRNAFDFAEDVIADPSLLEQIPNGSQVLPVPKAEREPGVHYPIETARMLATWTPGDPDEEPLPWPPCDPDEETLAETVAETGVIPRRD